MFNSSTTALSSVLLALAVGCTGSNGASSNTGGTAGALSSGGGSAGGASSAGSSALAGSGNGGSSAVPGCPAHPQSSLPCDIRQAGNNCGYGNQCFSCTCISQQPGTACTYQVTDCPSNQCVAEQGSCTQGETCCAGLTCCTGVPVPAGSEYCSATCPRSDQGLKRGFASVNEGEVLERLSKLPISTWSYKTESTEVKHLGPMAQDFKAAFGLGESDRTILQVDADGVAFAAIQALNARLIELETSNRSLAQRIKQLEAEGALKSTVNGR